MNNFLSSTLRQKNTAVAGKLFKDYDAEFSQITKMEIESYDSKRRKLGSGKTSRICKDFKI
jgi:hypothetical protein